MKKTIKLRWEITNDNCLDIEDRWLVYEIANDIEIAAYGPMPFEAAKEFRENRQHLMEKAIMECALRELRSAAEIKRLKERGLSCSGQPWSEANHR